MTVLATYLATNPWNAPERTHNFIWGSRYLRTITLKDDASPQAAYDLTGCTFKLYVWKTDPDRTALVDGVTLTAGSGTVTYQVTAAQAATFPRGRKVIWQVTCESSASPNAFQKVVITYGESLVVGA